MTPLRLCLPLLLATTAFAAPASDDPAALAASGNAAYRRGDTAAAVLSWERALALDRKQPAARAGLAVAAHDGSQAPRPGATETYAGLLPTNAWILLLATGAWTSVTLLALPLVSPFARRGWHHPVAGLAATLALFAVPGIAGAAASRKQAVVMKPETHLLLTPTDSGEHLATFAPGDRVRITGRHGDIFVRVKAPGGEEGWLPASRIEPVIPNG